MGLSLAESAATCGAHCWIERRLFEVLGAWASDAASPAATLCFDRSSLHAAWRAEQWWQRLPVLAGVDPEDQVRAPTGWETLLGAAGHDAPDADDVERLAIWARTGFPRLLRRYRDHAERATPSADGPSLRTLGHVIADLRADAADADALLLDHLVDAAAVERAAAATRRADLAFVAPAP